MLRWRVGEHVVDMGTYRGGGGQKRCGDFYDMSG